MTDDASPKTKKEITYWAFKYKVNILTPPITSAELAQILKTQAAVVAVEDQNFSNMITQKVKNIP